MYIRKKILFIFILLFSFTVFTQDIEEIIVKGEYREKSILEEDSSILIQLQTQEQDTFKYEV